MMGDFMKDIKLVAELINSDNEPIKIETKGRYDKINKIIEYVENDLNVKLKITNNKIILNRKNEDYDLNLEFELNKRLECKYKVKTIGLDLELDVYTSELKITDKELYINYELFSENNSIGVFKYKLLFEE